MYNGIILYCINYKISLKLHDTIGFNRNVKKFYSWSILEDKKKFEEKRVARSITKHFC